MNEKLMEMSREAHSFAHKTKGSSYDNPEYDDAFAQKFAELIVQECIGIVKQRWINPDEDVIAEEIKQHFGVEE